jgi:RNA polymerase sigma-70 factor, ECF subfamily
MASASDRFVMLRVLPVRQNRPCLPDTSIRWLAMSNGPPEIDGLLQGAGDGPEGGFSELFEKHRLRLRRMVQLRLDPRIAKRVDASDVVQEAYLEAWRRLAEYRKDPKMPFFLWLRSLTAQSLLVLHRRHLGVQARDVSREISLHWGIQPEATSAALAQQIISRQTSPTKAARRAEMKSRLDRVLRELDPMDREVLALRHFEQLTNTETARTLGIDPSAASKRYVRALRRLRELLTALGGDMESLRP